MQVFKECAPNSVVRRNWARAFSLKVGGVSFKTRGEAADASPKTLEDIEHSLCQRVRRRERGETNKSICMSLPSSFLLTLQPMNLLRTEKGRETPNVVY